MTAQPDRFSAHARSLKKRAERLLKNHPALFALGSRLYHSLHRSFDTLSPGAPDAIRDALAHLARAGEVGDYYEFGLFRGYTFWYAQEACRRIGISGNHFYGFDSFAGLPSVEGVDRVDSTFFEGQFACSKQEVMRNLSRRGVDWTRTTLIEGYFSDSLTEELKRKHAFGPVAVAFIDCDLYASTRDVLCWLEELLVDNSILLFDDWHCFGDRPDLGQQRAFMEFMEAQDRFEAVPFSTFENHGKGFLLKRR